MSHHVRFPMSSNPSYAAAANLQSSSNPSYAAPANLQGSSNPSYTAPANLQGSLSSAAHAAPEDFLSDFIFSPTFLDAPDLSTLPPVPNFGDINPSVYTPSVFSLSGGSPILPDAAISAPYAQNPAPGPTRRAKKDLTKFETNLNAIISEAVVAGTAIWIAPTGANKAWELKWSESDFRTRSVKTLNAKIANYESFIRQVASYQLSRRVTLDEFNNKMISLKLSDDALAQGYRFQPGAINLERMVPKTAPQRLTPAISEEPAHVLRDRVVTLEAQVSMLDTQLHETRMQLQQANAGWAEQKERMEALELRFWQLAKKVHGLENGKSSG